MDGSRSSSKFIKSKQSLKSGGKSKVQQLVMKYENNSKEKDSTMLRLNSKSIKSKSRNFLPSKSNKLKGTNSIAGSSKSSEESCLSNFEQPFGIDDTARTNSGGGGSGTGSDDQTGPKQIVKNFISQNGESVIDPRDERADSPNPGPPIQVTTPNSNPPTIDVSDEELEALTDNSLKQSIVGQETKSKSSDSMIQSTVPDDFKTKTPTIVDSPSKPVKDIIQNIYEHFYNNSSISNQQPSPKHKEKIKTDLIISDLVKLYSNSKNNDQNDNHHSHLLNIQHKSNDKQGLDNDKDNASHDPDHDINGGIDNIDPKPNKKCSSQVTKKYVKSATTHTHTNNDPNLKIADEGQTGGRGDDLNDELDEHTDSDSEPERDQEESGDQASSSGEFDQVPISDLDEYKEYETFYQRLQSIIQSNTGILVQDLNISFECYRKIVSKCLPDDRWMENMRLLYQPKVVVIQNYSSLDSDDNGADAAGTGQADPDDRTEEAASSTADQNNHNRCFNEKVRKVRIQSEEVYIYSNGVTVDINNFDSGPEVDTRT